MAGEVKGLDEEKRRNEDLLLDGERELKAFLKSDITTFSARQEIEQGGKFLLAPLFTVILIPFAPERM